MASEPANPRKDVPPLSGRRDSLEMSQGPSDTLVRILKPLASLKLTVVLFALAIFIVFAGTVAQVDHGIDEVVKNYFRCAVARIELQIFFPRDMSIPGAFYFPGGWLIGCAMAINLVAAHSLRFKIQSAGSRLKMGLGVIAAGVVMTGLVVVSGSNKDGLQGDPLIPWNVLWRVFQGLLASLWVAAAYEFATITQERKVERYFLLGVLLGLGPVLGWMLFNDNARLGESSLRILWQLLKGGIASLVLLTGCIMVFRKRAGVVLLHAGVGLLMFSELYVGLYAREGLMLIEQGETINYTINSDAVELAIVDPSGEETDFHVVIPGAVLRESADDDTVISHPDLPFDVKAKAYYQNSKLQRARIGDPSSRATTGMGRGLIVENLPQTSGASTGGAVDIASAYVELFEKGSDRALGTYLVSQNLARPDRVTVKQGGPDTQGGEVDETSKTYEMSLRFERNYRPYSICLKDVRKDDYLGTDTPRNYSSDIQLVDPTRGEDRDIHIRMNDPLRYAGETFYQSNYSKDPSTGVESTTLQVVSNSGWMIPYVSCMIVATGLLAQFSITLLRFLRRRSAKETLYKLSAYSMTMFGGGYAGILFQHLAGKEAESRKQRKKRRQQRAEQAQAPPEPESSAAATVFWVFPTAVVVLAALWVASAMRTPGPTLGQPDYYQFGELPLVYEGREKPFDTLARNSLRIISDKQTYQDADGHTQPAVRWLLDVITDRRAAEEHKVFRIENLELLDTLGLERRKRYRYALIEFSGKISELDKQAKLARQNDRNKLSLYQQKVLQLERKLRLYLLLRESFAEIDPPAGSKAQFNLAEMARRREYRKFMLPHMVPPVSESQKWTPYTFAYVDGFRDGTLQGDNPTAMLHKIFTAYRAGAAAAFNSEVREYRDWLAKDSPVDMSLGRVDFEAFFNHLEPFYRASVLYVFAFVLAALAWLGWSGPLNRASLWLILFTLCLHTGALVGRIYISGRPPVTNLYSSAVFIGWGCVLLAVGFEFLYRMGIGNIIASVTGFATLLIAHFLAGDGDTFEVLQAVLDTQFWLATHVTCITMGYATTYIAGMLGVLYIVRGVCTPSLSPEVGKELARMIYGTLCFALFFSFVGTVLGGLWADDSWGRFWGWDPKENGALMIVLWVALVLHARWDGMVKERGLAVLATAGNIAVSWSWFGVNELGAGLHSYGFTEGVTLALVLFAGSQLVLVVLGSLPKQYWWSYREHEKLT
jgi:ABC-type transport system involved in cytochrome c biogenesis permease subunit